MVMKHYPQIEGVDHLCEYAVSGSYCYFIESKSGAQYIISSISAMRFDDYLKAYAPHVKGGRREICDAVARALDDIDDGKDVSSFLHLTTNTALWVSRSFDSIYVKLSVNRNGIDPKTLPMDLFDISRIRERKTDK